MKKNLKMLLAGIGLCSVALLSACTPPNKYLITAYPSDSTLGSVIEASSINLTEKTEGTKLTLTAKENHEQSNPFICWIKDYKNIVSISKTLELTYNSQNQGNYTAVFSETNLSNMMFSAITEISYEAFDNSFSSVKYEIFYAETSSGSDNYISYETDSFAIDETHEIAPNAVLYFGSAGADLKYKLQVKIELVSVGDSITTIYYNLNDLVSKNMFDTSGKMQLSHSVTNYGTLNLNLEKLNINMFE